MLDFSPRPIPSPILPQSLPFTQSDPFRPQPRTTLPADNDFSSLLSNLQLNTDSQAQLVTIQAQSIADLKTESQQDKAIIRELKNDLGKVKVEMSQLKTICHEEFTQLCSSLQQEFLQVRTAFDSSSSSTASRFDRLELVAPVKKAFVNPVYYSHIFFSRAPKETNSFCFFMRNTLEQLHSQFADEKHKVMWLAGYF
jgi:hypothetical protein